MVRTPLIIISLLAMLLTACSGASEVTDDPSDPGDTAAVEADADAAADTDGSAPADTGDVAIDASQCSEIAEALTAVPQGLAGAATGTVDTAAIQAQAESLADVADQVPAEYRDDFTTVADAFASIADTLGGVSLEPGQVPDPETLNALTELSTELSSGEFAAASANISTFFAGGCQ